MLHKDTIINIAECLKDLVYFQYYLFKLNVDHFLCRSGQPVPIEYLPAEHTLDSRVRLVIKYQVAKDLKQTIE